MTYNEKFPTTPKTSAKSFFWFSFNFDMIFFLIISHLFYIKKLVNLKYRNLSIEIVFIFLHRLEALDSKIDEGNSLKKY